MDDAGYLELLPFSLLITVGEMPGVTVEEARLYTDPARRELDTVFQFEHVQVDHGTEVGSRAPSRADHSS